MDELQRAVAPFYPASGGMGGGFNPPPGPSENSWVVAPSSADELRRGQEVGESQAPFCINMRDPTTGMPIYKAPSPGGRVEVFDIPESPTDVNNPEGGTCVGQPSYSSPEAPLPRFTAAEREVAHPAPNEVEEVSEFIFILGEWSFTH